MADMVTITCERCRTTFEMEDLSTGPEFAWLQLPRLDETPWICSFCHTPEERAAFLDSCDDETRAAFLRMDAAIWRRTRRKINDG